MNTVGNLLAAHFGGANSNEEALQKAAEAEIFAKVAADCGVDLTKLSQEQIYHLWNEVMVEGNKTAAEEEHHHESDEEEKKKEEALAKAVIREHEEKKEAMAKVAEAEYIGERMADAFHARLQKLAAEDHEKREEEKKKEEKKEEDGKKMPVKEASATDLYAARVAIGMLKEAGLSTEQGVELLNSLFTLGHLPESTKTAGASTPEQTVQIRALELLEAAGYPINWG